MEKKAVILVYLILILLAAGFFRFFHLGSESIWSDEGYSIYEASGPFDRFVEALKYDYNPPLYPLVLRAWVTGFGTSEFSVRSLSALFGIVSVYLVYLLGSQIFSRKAAIYASLIAAFSVFSIMYSQEARSYSLFMMLCLLSYMYFFKLKETINSKYALLYIIFTLLMLYTHFFGFFILLAQNISYLTGRQNLRKWVLMQSAVLAGVIPYLVMLLQQLGNFALSSGWMERPGLGTISYILFLQGGNYLLLVLLVMAAAFALSRRRDSANLALALWWIIPILVPFLLAYWVKPFLYPRYTLPSSIALYLLAGQGVALVKSKGFRLLILVTIILLSLGSIVWYYVYPAKEDWRAATNYIDAIADNSTRILFYPGFTEYLVYDYYSTKNTTTYQVTYSTRALNKTDVDRVGRMVGEYEKLILVMSNDCYSQELVDRIGEGYLFRDEEDFTKIRVMVFYNGNASTLLMSRILGSQ